MPDSSSISRDASGARIGELLTKYYAANDLPRDGGEGQRWFHVRLGKLSLPIPNPPARRRAVFFHDINHLLTGYNTTFSEGEMEIAAFEIGAGCGKFYIVWFINLFMMGLGLALRPRAVLRAFATGRRSLSIYRDDRDRTALRAATVSTLRADLHIDQSERRA